MSVLFIGKRFYTNRDALREQYGRIHQLPKHWAEAGIQTRLWLVDYHSRERVGRSHGLLEIESTPVKTLAVAGRLFREWFQREDKPDVVVASGDCYIGILGYRIARHLRARFVFDVYDKYDEFGGYRALPGFDPFSFLLRKADARLFASHALMQRLQSRSGVDLPVLNGIDVARFKPIDKQEARRALGLSAGATLVGYFGSLDLERGVTDLMAAVRQLRESGLEIELLLGGRLANDVDIAQPAVRYLGNLGFENVPTALACCDLLALPYRNSPYLDMASSCKIAEYIAVRRPIVATRTPNLVENFPLQAAQLEGLLATPGDAVDLARVIRRQLASPMLVDMPLGMDWASIAQSVTDGLSLRHA